MSLWAAAALQRACRQTTGRPDRQRFTLYVESGDPAVTPPRLAGVGMAIASRSLPTQYWGVMIAYLTARLPATISEVLEFHIHGDAVGLILALVLYHTYGIKRLADTFAPRGESVVTARQRTMYFTGVALLAVVRTWPFHDIGEGSLFTFHMTEHMVMAFAVPPLLLAGTPGWLLAATVRPILRILRFLTKPIVALVLFNSVLAALHWTTAVELMITNSAFHLLAHGALLTTALLMWWPVLGPIGELPRLSPFPRMGYLFLQSLVPVIPASFLTLAQEPLYEIYEKLPRMWGISAVNDQAIAGLVMKLGAGLVLWGAIAWTFFAWYAEENETARPKSSIDR